MNYFINTTNRIDYWQIQKMKNTVFYTKLHLGYAVEQKNMGRIEDRSSNGEFLRERKKHQK